MNRRLIAFTVILLLSLQSVSAFSAGPGSQASMQGQTQDCAEQMEMDGSDTNPSDCCNETCVTAAGCAVFCAVYSLPSHPPISFGVPQANETSAFVSRLKLAPESTPLNPPPIH